MLLGPYDAVSSCNLCNLLAWHRQNVEMTFDIYKMSYVLNSDMHIIHGMHRVEVYGMVYYL